MAGPRSGRAEAVAVAARLLRLEARLARAERQLRAALALRGRLQALERRLESGGAARRAAAGRGAAGGGREAARPRARRVPVGLEDVWVQFSEREWRALRGWQRALHRAVLRSNCPTLLSGGKGPGERPQREGAGGQRAPAAPRPPAPAEPEAPRRDAQAPAEGGNGPCGGGSCEDGSGDPAETGTEDSIIHIKQEEELYAADQQEEEAGEAPEEPCPAEQAFCEPEASSEAKPGREACAGGLPGAEGEDLPRDPAAGFQTYATDVVSWIKQEEEPRCPERQDLEKEEISTGPSTVHNENTKRDPPADCFENTVCDSEVPGRCGEKFSKHPSPGVTWDSQWNSEMMETNTPGIGLGSDAQYDRGFGEHLDFFSSQENSVGKRPCTYSKCERNSSQQEHPPTPQGAREGEVFPGPTCEKNLNERVFHLLHSQPCAPAEKDPGQGAAPASCEAPERGQNPEGGTRLRDHGGLDGEEQPTAESEESFLAEHPLASPCWDHPQDRSEGCGKCRQHLVPRGSPASQQPSHVRGKSYICSDCGKSFVCHSWLVRHQMTHTGERPYKCSECDKSYRRKDYLLNHQRRHSGEGLFQCPLCRKRFVLRRSFMKHQESHMQETHMTLAGWPCTEIRGSVMHSI
ncbi:zinc finger protein 282-like isoform X2 [Tyto alba]|uniref:zinc finger protein 282-like isoform X2 n=1 Tax=Tyto alba TaxID=56313 RepID=UPI001C67A088|nr:zinc finger protein 282-like isoform X2 [Tyto alba]